VPEREAVRPASNDHAFSVPHERNEALEPWPYQRNGHRLMTAGAELCRG